MFHEGKPTEMAPHVYAVAQSSYHSLRKSHENQSVVVLGYSGSGKSTTVYHLLSYFQRLAALPHADSNFTGIVLSIINNPMVLIRSE